MAEESIGTSTPAVPASAPAAAPSTPAPAAPAAPAVPATPATPEAPAQPDLAGKSTLEVVKQLSHDAIEKAKKPAEVVAPPVEPVKPAVEAAKVDAAAKPPDQKEPVKAADDKPADADSDEDIIPAEDLTLSEMGMLSPSEFAQIAKDNAEFEKFLNEHPDLKGKFGYTLRKASDLGKVAALGITSERQAKFVLGQTQLMNDIESSLTQLNVKDDKGFDGFTKVLGIMGTLDIVRDEDTGEPVKDAQGNYQRHGFASDFALRSAQTLLDSLEQEAEAGQDPTILAAVRTIKERITRSSSASDDDLTDAQRAEQQKILADRQALDKEKFDAKRNKRTQTEAAATETSLKDLNGSITKFLGQTALDEFAKEVVVGRARTAFYERIEQDPVFKQQRNYLAAQPQTKDVLAERRALVREAIANYLPTIMRKELQRAGATQIGKQKEADDKTKALQAASRHDISGAAPVPAAATNETDEAALGRIEKDFIARNGRKPTTREIVSLQFKDQQARRAGAPRA